MHMPLIYVFPTPAVVQLPTYEITLTPGPLVAQAEEPRAINIQQRSGRVISSS